MEIRDVAPCHDCGGERREIMHFYSKRHTYARFSFFEEEVLLCNRCTEDFSAYSPEFFGLQKKRRVGLGSSTFRPCGPATEKDLRISKDKYCSHCQMRLEFLKFILRIRSKEHSEKTASIRVAD